jgi:hypothetical protein
LEAWEKIFINLGSKEKPGDLDIHMNLRSCVDCHGGDPAVQHDPEAAHAGLIADPSAPEHGACNDCHAQVADTYFNSMHATLQGEKQVLATRAGFDTFEQCPETLRNGFAGECSSCHATCGDCHISRPDTNGKGFIKDHRFQKKPHQLNQCMGCHGARIGFDFMGDDEVGRKPDIHFSKGMSCMSCHSGTEMHMAAGDAPDRYHLDGTPKCVDCHDVEEANAYHQQHWNDLSCHVCHAQADYVNCAGCHVAGQYKKDPEYTENNPFEAFRIGRNPFLDRPHKYVTLRHAPTVPDTFEPWGYDGNLPAFDALPTWKYTTPHSIRRWTPRTEVPGGAGCGASCHLGTPDGSPANAGIFLWRDEVLEKWPAEAGANEAVVVDDALPAGWTGN